MEDNKLSKFNNVPKYLQLLVVGVILSVAFFLLFSNIFKSYQSTVEILIIAKSEATGLQQDKIVENIMQLPETLAFYDRLLKSNTDVRDVWASQDADDRKNAWDDMIKVEKSRKNSSVIKMTITAVNESDSYKLVSKSSRTLFDTVGLYYDIKSEVDMRLIDGPISRTVVSSWPWLLLLSVLIGGSLAALLQEASGSTIVLLKNSIEILKKKNTQKKTEEFSEAYKTDEALKSEIKGNQTTEDLTAQKEHVEDPFEIRKDSEMNENQAKHDKEMETLNKIIQQDIYPNFPEMPVSHSQKSNAPDNLPIADSSFYPEHEQITNEPDQDKVVEEKKEGEIANHEPTPEELKKRLNELLKGKI